MDDYTLSKLTTELFNKYMKIKKIPKGMTEANLLDRTEFKKALGEVLANNRTAIAYLDSLKVPAELEGKKLTLKERIQWLVSSLTSHSYIMQGGK